MKQNQTAPAAQGRLTGAGEIIRAANIDVTLLTYQQARVYRLLSDGHPRSTADISIALRMADPRAVIRDLRHRGVPISDTWCADAYSPRRYKRYFIRKGGVRQ